ncbi:hypothetical protein HU751_023575 [Pseudomonas sp. BW13M1]|uniref:Uncharacterized protein n=1 Tax=Pseudomonas peradeniyensis TaxID=2745488 RepID=A0A923GB91_9PSED|nr:hypothetical protein [Pseudomonas peradeniyensis]MBV4507817.1 hypothetical protein [Pseudomonas peradeniyensis]
MTYCVIWKTEHAAFIAADSAVTSYGNNISGNPKGASSLGQHQGLIAGTKYVCEGAFKIFRTTSVALCLSGDLEFGLSLVNLTLTHLENNKSPHEALTLACNNFPDFNQRPPVKIAAVHCAPEPTITVLDTLAQNPVSIANQLVELGSPPRDLKQYTSVFHKAFHDCWKEEVKTHEKANEFMLIRMLALLQIYGMHNPTLSDNGIGGSFTGVHVTTKGVHEQPDICYLLCGELPYLGDSTCTLTRTKPDHFCIVNTHMCLTIGNGQDNRKTCDDALDESLLEAQRIFDSGRFDYVVILNKSRHTATAIQMDRQLHHTLLSLDTSDDEAGSLGFVFSKKLEKLINDNYEAIDAPRYAAIAFSSFEAPPSAIIEEHEDVVNELKSRDLQLYSSYPLVFSIHDEKNIVDSYLGCTTTVMPFIKHFRNQHHLSFSDWRTGELKLEYKNGYLSDIPADFPLDEHLEIIPAKDNEFDIYAFILEPASRRFSPRSSQVLAHDWDEAEEFIRFEVDDEPEKRYTIRRTRKIFYHQAYNRPTI